MNKTSAANYYGVGKIRDSLIHFLFGKAFSAIATFVVVVTVIRELEVAEYAIYVTLQALVLFLRMLTSLGINSALLRFLPDLRVVGNNRSTYVFLVGGVVVRGLLYALPVAVLMLLAGDWLVRVLKLGDLAWILGWYLVVGFFRIMAMFTAASLESLLWQKQSQYSIALSTIVRLVAVLYLVSEGTLNLVNLMIVELATEGLALLLLVGGGTAKWLRDPKRQEGTLSTLKTDFMRYVRFSWWAYLFNLTTVLHGSAPNRLIVSYVLGPATTALFGAIDRLIQFVKQYEPVKLLLGLIRPVINASYRTPDDYPTIMSMADGIFRLNLAVLVLPLLPCAIAGTWVFELVTNGKYGDAAGLFLGFYFILVLGSCMMVLELLVKAVELTYIFVGSNLVLSASVLLALPFLDSAGLWALVVAISFGYCVAIVVVASFLNRKGFTVRIRWDLVAMIVGGCAVAIVAGHVLLAVGLHELIAISVAYATFIALMLVAMPFTGEEQEAFWNMIRHRPGRHAD